MARVLERVIKVHRAGLVLRVWCRATDLRDNDEYERQRAGVVEAIKAAEMVGGGRDDDAAAAAEKVAELDFCSAVEVQDGPVRPAVLIYPEWP